MLVSSIISETSKAIVMDFSGGSVRVQKTYHSHGVDGEARPDDICPGGMQHPAHVHPWLLLEGPQQQPCKFKYDSIMLLLAAEISMGSTKFTSCFVGIPNNEPFFT